MDEQTRLKLHNQLQLDLHYFAKKAPLLIKDKSGRMVPLVFNEAQEYAHLEIERQRAKTGKVRALVLKARQEGISTYIAARYYHKATRQRDKSVFILSHEAQTTEKLFRIVERYQTGCNTSLRPSTKISNRREYRFAEIGSEYSVGTAGNENVGRGGTIQYFHGSEVAFWEHTDGIETGIMQSIADMGETEIILESTANGMGNMFYRKCMDAMKGKGEFVLIFIPWFWMREYQREPPADFRITPEEETYRKLYNLNAAQMCWRRIKIESFGGEWKFKQEYPANPIEAFQTSGAMLINPEDIMTARRNFIEDPVAPLIIGLDPGRKRDRSVFAPRRGRKMYPPIIYDPEKLGHEVDEMWLASKASNIIDRMKPDKMFIDVTKGYGTYDRLIQLGYKAIVIPVNFGAGALESELYRNKRVEMWCNMRDWFESGGKDIPDDDDVHSDLACMPATKETASGVQYLDPKAKIIETYGMSPDIGDAEALTFAFPVRKGDNGKPLITKKNSSRSRLKTMSRMRGDRQRPRVASSATHFS